MTWRRSTNCSGGSCVEVETVPEKFDEPGSGMVRIRDGKLGDRSPVLSIPAADWPAVQELIKSFR